MNVRMTVRVVTVLATAFLLVGCSDDSSGGNNNNQEVCDNGIDDDGDLAIDCDDPDCAGFGGCAPECGNNLRESGEVCDGSDFGDNTCQTEGRSGGTLACDTSCQLVTTGCHDCGDGNCGLDEDPQSCLADCGDMVSLNAIGAPKWRPDGAALFEVTCGLIPSNPEVTDIRNCVVNAPEHTHGITYEFSLPGVAHDAPYEDEVIDGAGTCGYTVTDTFPASALEGEQGIVFGFVIVPTVDATQGSSPDFAHGLIIPDALLPIGLSGATSQDGVVVDSAWNFQLPKTTTLGLTVDGFSHVPMMFFENQYWLPPQPREGFWQIRLLLLDAESSGWVLRAWFTVVP